MASGGSMASLPFCTKCGIEVEILNGDVQFSLQLHKQSHKTLESISKEINQQEGEAQGEPKCKLPLSSNYTCPVCNKAVEILNNDVVLSLQLHAQEHSLGKGRSYTPSEDQSSNSSGKSKNSRKGQSSIGTDAKNKPKPEGISIIDTIFNLMPAGLSSHKGFVSENGNSIGEAFCNICNAKINSVLSIAEHLKTKLHEDNTISFLKEKLSPDLDHIMEFVSFYGSNLCCNLCRCKIDLCSNNAYETIVNIITHNSGKSHLSKKSSDESGCKSNESGTLLKVIASISSLVNDNINLIDSTVQPQFKCKLCDKGIPYNHNIDVLLENFTTHLASVSHGRCVKACSVVRSIKASSVPGKEKHEFIASKSCIFCSVCGCHIEADYDQVVLHITRQTYALQTDSSDLTANLMNMSLNSPCSSSSNNLESPIMKSNSVLDSDSATRASASPISSEVTDHEFVTEQQLKRILRSLPKQYHNINYVVLNSKICGQVTCLICNCGIPASNYNLRTHLEGKRHKTNEKTVKTSVNLNKNITGVPKSESVLDNRIFDQVYQSLIETDPVIAVSSKMFAIHEDGKHFICSLCNALIEMSLNYEIFRNNIHWHIDSFGHSYRLKLQNDLAGQTANENQCSTVKNLFSWLPASLQQNMKFIKAREGETSVHCTLCDLKVSAHASCLKEHLKGARHTASLNMLKPTRQYENRPSSDEEIWFKTIMADNRIKNQEKYLVKKGEHYFCNICKCPITRCYDDKLFKENILTHITGERHKKNVDKARFEILNELQLSNPLIESNRKYLKVQAENVLCVLCECPMSLSAEKEKLRQCLVQHLVGGQHTSNITASSFSKIQPTSTIPPCEDSTAKEINRLFEELPVHFQDDINFITYSTIEGYLSCSLCSSIINPHYLKEHLEEKNHIQKKPNSVQSSPRSVPVCATENQEVLQNMGSLTSLLGKIDKKLSWPLKQ